MSTNNLEKNSIDSLFDDVGLEEEIYDSKPVTESLEEAVKGNVQIEVEYDDSTQDFLDELSDFLEDEGTDYLSGMDDDYDLPSLEDFEDEPLPSLDELDDEPVMTQEEYDEKYEFDDEETAVLRAEAANIALGLMNYVEYNVVTLENELTILGDAFNQLLDKTGELDEKIARLSEKVTKARLEGTKQALDFIHSEIKLISDNLEGAITSTDPTDREVLQENVDILNENKNVIENQIKGLKEIGAKTEKLEKDLDVLNSSIGKLKAAMDSNKIFSIANLISSEVNQVIVQTRDARRVEDEQDIAVLQENFDLLMENKSDIEDRIWDLADRGLDIEGLKDQLEVLNINLEQFNISMDESIHRLNMSVRKK